MTTATINNKRISLTIEEKARLLTVFDTFPGLASNELAVSSGSRKHTAYVVSHDGKHVHHCSCDARIERCAHAIAGQWFLDAQNRAAYEAAFNPNDIN